MSNAAIFGLFGLAARAPPSCSFPFLWRRCGRDQHLQNAPLGAEHPHPICHRQWHPPPLHQGGRRSCAVLLHTLRTQLDLFEKVVPALARSFAVYAVDYPGHGYSDIPTAKYDAVFFADASKVFSRP